MTTKAYFFACHDRVTCCRLPGVHTIEAATLDEARGAVR